MGHLELGKHFSLGPLPTIQIVHLFECLGLSWCRNTLAKVPGWYGSCLSWPGDIATWFEFEVYHELEFAIGSLRHP